MYGRREREGRGGEKKYKSITPLWKGNLLFGVSPSTPPPELVELHDLVAEVAGEEELVPGLDDPRETHEEGAVDAKHGGHLGRYCFGLFRERVVQALHAWSPFQERTKKSE